MNRLYSLLMVFALLSLLGGCEKDDYGVAAYKTLALSGETYNAVMSSVAEAYAAKAIDDDAKAKAVALGNAFYGVWHTGLEALEVYVTAKDAAAEKRLTTTLSAVGGRLDDLLAYAVRIGIGVRDMREGK